MPVRYPVFAPGRREPCLLTCFAARTPRLLSPNFAVTRRWCTALPTMWCKISLPMSCSRSAPRPRWWWILTKPRSSRPSPMPYSLTSVPSHARSSRRCGRLLTAPARRASPGRSTRSPSACLRCARNLRRRFWRVVPPPFALTPRKSARWQAKAAAGAALTRPKARTMHVRRPAYWRVAAARLSL